MNLMTVQVLGQAYCFGLEAAAWGSRGFACRDKCQKLYNIMNDEVSLKQKGADVSTPSFTASLTFKCVGFA